MGARSMKLITQMQNVWDNGTQAAVMAHLAWWESDTAEYASVSYGYLARICGVERRYIVRVMEQLQLEKGAVVNLGPDPDDGGRGRNRWKLTLDAAIAKVRRDADVGDDVPLHRLERRRVRRRAESTVVIPGSPEKDRKGDAGDVDDGVRDPFGGAGITPLVIPGSPPGDPRINTLVIPGSPQSGPVVRTGTSVIRECTAAAADAPAASPNLEFQLIGEVRSGRHDRTAKQALDARRAQLYERIKRHARWLLDHPDDAAALNGGVPLESEAALITATQARCAAKRIPGRNEGDVLVNVCRSEWHLFQCRRKVFDNSGEITRLRDLRRSSRHETTRGTRRKGGPHT